jgi:hypothetical protein
MVLDRLLLTGGATRRLIYLAPELPYKVSEALEFSYLLDIHMA